MIGCDFMKNDDLRRLNELRQKGIISEEEYNKRKEKMTNMRSSQVYHIEANHKQEYDKARTASVNTQSKHQHPPLSYSFQPPIKLPKSKSKLLAGFLGMFLGVLGIHNFYLEYYGKGIVQLLLTLFCSIFLIFGVGILLYIPFVWGFVEGILILLGLIRTDAHGVELR